VDEHGLAFVEAPDLVDERVRGGQHDRKRRRRAQVESFWHGEGQRSRREHDIGIGAVDRERGHRLSDRKIGHPLADRVHVPGRFEPGHERQRFHPVPARTSQHVGEVDPGVGHVDRNLSGPRSRLWPLLDP
jgi:hypothetical protein